MTKEQTDGARAVRELREAYLGDLRQWKAASEAVITLFEQAQLERECCQKELATTCEDRDAANLKAEQAQTDFQRTRTERDAVRKELEQAQRERNGLREQVVSALKQVAELIGERNDLAAKCERLEAACAKRKEIIEFISTHTEHIEGGCQGYCQVCSKVDEGLADDCGQPLLDERDRLRKALKSIASGDPHGPSGATAREALSTPGKEGE